MRDVEFARVLFFTRTCAKNVFLPVVVCEPSNKLSSPLIISFRYRLKTTIQRLSLRFSLTFGRMHEMELSTFIARIAVAVISGMVIGLERQWHHKQAGLGTNTLVALGAAIYVLISLQLTTESGDLTRIIGQVVVGVGFLGAGVIMHRVLDIQGLTTAATIWCSSAIGCLAGAGLFGQAAVSTLAVIFVNVLMRQAKFKLKEPKNDQPPPGEKGQ